MSTELPPPAPDGSPVCGATTSIADDVGTWINTWTCTAERGHAGDHVAYGPDGEIYANWPPDPTGPPAGGAS